ncbi:MAG: hypothetical protein AB1650_08750 [Candidatus Omnitrophota bacterium]
MKKNLAVLIFFFSIIACAGLSVSFADDVPVYERIAIIGEKGANGIFDPSIVYQKDGTGWMVYSSVNFFLIETNLAVTNDGGKTWRFVATINKAVKDSVKYRGWKVKGFWVHETPSLVYDPEDTGREWKLFWHKYFYKAPFGPKNHIWTYGGIAFKYASAPDGPWSEEILLPMRDYQKFYDKKVPVMSDIDSSLRHFSLFYEVGAVSEEGIIYLSLDASVTETGLGMWDKRKVILLSSQDHGKSWNFVNELTTSADAVELGYLAFSASSIVKEKGRLFLLVSPVGSLKGRNKGHDGAYVFEFEDISRGLLKRDAQKGLIAHKFIPLGLTKDEPDDNYESTSGGPSGYDENNSYGGVVFSQINPRWGSRAFRLYNTQIKIVDQAGR